MQSGLEGKRKGNGFLAVGFCAALFCPHSSPQLILVLRGALFLPCLASGLWGSRSMTGSPRVLSRVTFCFLLMLEVHRRREESQEQLCKINRFSLFKVKVEDYIIQLAGHVCKNSGEGAMLVSRWRNPSGFLGRILGGDLSRAGLLLWFGWARDSPWPVAWMVWLSVSLRPVSFLAGVWHETSEVMWFVRNDPSSQGAYGSRGHCPIT